MLLWSRSVSNPRTDVNPTVIEHMVASHFEAAKRTKLGNMKFGPNVTYDILWNIAVFSISERTFVNAKESLDNPDLRLRRSDHESTRENPDSSSNVIEVSGIVICFIETFSFRRPRRISFCFHKLFVGNVEVKSLVKPSVPSPERPSKREKTVSRSFISGFV